ncbi:MAG: hypothetical protein M1834_004264 [Cirrosporium novae-zelandiae]|nr:MAG: hypothetical protein M1834_004264 [Cirrosporium novae-zelandiae]
MDHIPVPEDPPYQPIRIPYYGDKNFDGLNFWTYLNQVERSLVELPIEQALTREGTLVEEAIKYLELVLAREQNMTYFKAISDLKIFLEACLENLILDVPDIILDAARRVDDSSAHKYGYYPFITRYLIRNIEGGQKLGKLMDWVVFKPIETFFQHLYKESSTRHLRKCSHLFQKPSYLSRQNTKHHDKNESCVRNSGQSDLPISSEHNNDNPLIQIMNVLKVAKSSEPDWSQLEGENLEEVGKFILEMTDNAIAALGSKNPKLFLIYQQCPSDIDMFAHLDTHSLV